MQCASEAYLTSKLIKNTRIRNMNTFMAKAPKQRRAGTVKKKIQLASVEFETG